MPKTPAKNDKDNWPWKIQNVLALELKQSEKLVLLYLYSLNDADNKPINISIREIADAVGSEKRWVLHCLRTLETQKLIERRPLYGPDGGQRASVFNLRKP